MELLAETYIVLDVPQPFASRVLDLRVQSGDDFRAALPVEITLIGSGGVGPITRHQDLGLHHRPTPLFDAGRTRAPQRTVPVQHVKSTFVGHDDKFSRSR